ncbi:MAG: HD domain-containing protein [Chloroflexi bacterium]|nr:HD domain-containing protein [Chloroflexota bacterium]
MAETRSPFPVPPEDSIRTADLIGALSLAASLGVGLSAEHATKSCYIGMYLAREIGLSPQQQADLYYTELLMDAGCTSYTSQIAAYVMGDEITARRELYFYTDTRNSEEVSAWLGSYMAANEPEDVRTARIQDFALRGGEFMHETFKSTCEVAQRFAHRLGMSSVVQQALLAVYEQWDGTGLPNGTRGEAIPIISRIVYATSFFEAFHHMGGRQATTELAQRRRGTAFDPKVVDAFLSASRQEDFWYGLEQETVWDTVMAMEPESSYRYLGEERLADVALCFADYVDLKSPSYSGHSRRVSDLAERIARRMSLPEEEVATIRLAGLVHDLGLVAVPSHTLGKPRERLNQTEWEAMRLHPYYSERILSKVSPWGGVASLVGAHHERMDGRGYYRGLSGTQIPIGARIIAVADHFDELTHDAPGHLALEPEAAANRMSREVAESLSPDAFHALMEELGGAFQRQYTRARRRDWPAGLTDREVEVLRLVAKGLSRRQIADLLFITEGTVRSHLEHIYGKLGVSTRAAATLFAMEHNLLQ